MKIKILERREMTGGKCLQQSGDISVAPLGGRTKTENFPVTTGMNSPAQPSSHQGSLRWGGEMTQQLRVCVVFAGNPCQLFKFRGI